MTYGFIGTGNMGGALARAAAKAVEVRSSIVLANRTPEKAARLADEIGASVADNLTVARECDYILLGVKPQMMADMLAEIAPALQERTTPFVLLSMAAGLTIQRIREMAGGDYPVIRIMPNTAVAVGEGVTMYCCSGPAGGLCLPAALLWPAGGAGREADGRGKRRGRLRRRVCLPVSGGSGGRRGVCRSAPRQGAALRRPDAAGHG